MSILRDPPLPVCPCSDPGTTHTVAAHWVKAEPMKGPLVFARDDSPAMSADPTAEHIDAVAETMSPKPLSYYSEWSGALKSYRLRAERILTSTDPAVHAALAASLPAEVMLAALVDRGTLTEEEWAVKCLCGKTLQGSPDEVRAWAREHDDSPKASHIVVWSPVSVRPWTHRHVTQGEVAP